jgi:lipopolysaccharide heptosyltransferase II
LTVQEITKFTKILVIRLSSLGDILLTTPLIRSIKNQFPSLQLDIIVRQEYADAIKLNPNISQRYFYSRQEKDNDDLIKKLTDENYDLIIDLQNNLRSKKITSFLNVKTERFDKKNWEKFLLVNFKINKLKKAPSIPVRYSQTVSDLILDKKGINLFSDKNTSEKTLDKNNLIGFCPGARHFSKRWPKEYFITLGKLLVEKGFIIVLFGGKIDKELCDEIANQISGSINLSNDDDLLQTASDMKECITVVCNDSGLMHVASAMDIKVITIFGSTVKEFGFAPYNCDNLILENNSLSCRPCSHIGKDRCPKKHFNCMMALKPEYVFDKIISFISNK